jgi:phosphoglycerate dehydrogenase-like enzyme
MFRIGVSEDFYEEAREHVESVIEQRLNGRPGIECALLPTPDKIASPEELDRFDAVFALATKIDAASLRGITRLACVARWGVGYDRIDTAALTEAGVVLCITPKAVRGPVAEAIFTFVFALAKNLPLQDRTARSGLWRGDLPKLGIDVAGTVLGSVGCGNIAQQMFGMARAFGFRRLLACDPYVTHEQVAGLGVEMTDMASVFRESDFVTVNTLLNESTRNLVREEHFRQMKVSAYFINTARGPIVDHGALVKALREKWIAGAGIDVYPVEPPPKDDPLFSLDNVIVAPHSMAWTVELMRNNGFEACDNVLALAEGKVPSSIVNREVLNSPRFRAKLERIASWSNHQGS